MSNSDFTSMIEEIRFKITSDQFEFSKHALDQSIVRQIRVREITEAIATSQLIEDYPNDKYGPSCLLCGVTQAGRPIHVQCSYPTRSLVKIITVYEPDPMKWANDFTIRRLNHDN
jgi:heterodisulfide reductase subunit C